ncbi:MAG: hypothetical protein ACLR0U_10980 [Enterocloster clostridioformis]
MQENTEPCSYPDEGVYGAGEPGAGVMLEVSPYDSNTENTAYFAARTGSYLYANQPGRTLYLQLCWQKNQSNSFALTIWITDSRDQEHRGNQCAGCPGRTSDLVFSGEKDLDSALKDAQANGEKAMEEARNN